MGFFDFLSNAWSGVKNFGKNVWDGVKSGFGKVKGVWDTVKNIAGKIKDIPVIGKVIESIYKRTPLSTIAQNFDDALGLAGGGIDTVERIGAPIVGGIDKVVGALPSQGPKITLPNRPVGRMVLPRSKPVS